MRFFSHLLGLRKLGAGSGERGARGLFRLPALCSLLPALKGSARQSLREELTTQLFVRQLEDRRVLNAHPLPLQTVAGVLQAGSGERGAGSLGV